MVLPRIRARPDRDEAIDAVRVCQAAAVPQKVWIQRCVMLIDPVPVPAGGVGLPDLNERTPQRRSMLVQDPAGDDDPLTHRLGPRADVRRQVGILRADGALHRLVQGGAHRRARAGDLRQRLRQGDERLLRRAAHRSAVRLVEVRGEGRGVASGAVHYGSPFPPRCVLAIANAAFAAGMPAYMATWNRTSTIS